MASFNNPTNNAAASANPSTSTTTLPIHSHRNGTPASSNSSASESESSDSLSSEEDSSEEDSDEEEATAVPTAAHTKPNMRANVGKGDLKSRLAAFLPQLAESNLQLENLKAKGELKSFEDVEEGEQYIEMDLGLGVLEEKKPGQPESEDEEEEEEEEEEDGGKSKEEDVLGKMMGFKKGRPNAGISEVDG